MTAVVEVLAKHLNVPPKMYNFTLPQNRQNAFEFQPEDLVVFGTPVYAGRVPNVLLNYLRTIRGSGASAVAVVTFGNRWYDDALAELTALLRNGGLRPVAAGAFAGEHAFSTVLGAGRPDSVDLRSVRCFAEEIVPVIMSQREESSLPLVQVGRPETQWVYYQPKDQNGVPIDIRKVKPVVWDGCIRCGVCASVCPMGSIDADDVSRYTGICIKCGACIKKCPQQVRDYVDPGYLYHKADLERSFTRRAEPEWFIASPDKG